VFGLRTRRRSRRRISGLAEFFVADVNPPRNIWSPPNFNIDLPPYISSSYSTFDHGQSLPSQVGVLLKRLNVGSRKQHHNDEYDLTDSVI